MREVKPSAELEGLLLPVRLVGKKGKKRVKALSTDPELVIEKAGRTCYRSEEKIGKGTAAKFVKMIKGRHHDSVTEHSGATIRVVTDCGVGRELTRHRLAAYSQECLSGDTVLAKKGKKLLTVREVVEKDMVGATVKSVIAGRVVPNEITAAFRKGTGLTFEVGTKLGYRLRATLAHEFMLPDASMARLGDLVVGDRVMVNGRPSLLCIDDDVLRLEYLSAGLAPQEIAGKYAAPYRSILRRLKVLGVFEKHRNDKDPKKYQRNHTAESVDKMRAAVVIGYENGRRPWNDGLDETHPAVKVQANALRVAHHDNPEGDGNSNWKGGVSRGVAQRKKSSVRCCEVCGRKTFELEVHHLDQNPRNNADENVVKLCENCHSKVHHGWWVGIVAHPDEIESIEPAGVEELFDLEMAEPAHNYVANGFVVHNSTRYCNYAKEKHGSEIKVIRPPFKFESSHAIWEKLQKQSERAYLDLLKCNEPPELARSVLTFSLATELVMTANFREYGWVKKLRTALAAHPQMRELMKPVVEILLAVAPNVFAEPDRHEGLAAVLEDMLPPRKKA